MSYQLFINGDGENFWTGYDSLVDALEGFLDARHADGKVSLVWMGEDYEEE